MITIDDIKEEVRVSDDTSLDELARFLNESPYGNWDYKIVIYGTDENTDTSG